MKYIKQIQLFILLVCGLNLSIHCNQNELQQRKLAAKEFIRQEQVKGTPLHDIKRQLWKRANNCPESTAYLQAQKCAHEACKIAQKHGCYPHRIWDFPIDPTQPVCKQIMKDYEKAKQKCKTLFEPYINTPEYLSFNELQRYLQIEQHIKTRCTQEKEKKRTQEEVEAIEKEIQALTQEKQDIMEKLGLSSESKLE